MYPPELVIPFKNQLTDHQFISLETAEEVDEFFSNTARDGTFGYKQCLWMCGRLCSARCYYVPQPP